MPLFPVIIGPTAGSKTELSVRLAAHLGACIDGPVEIISADSMQIYRGMDIGTAKPTPEELASITHHMIDIRDPHEAFSVSDWLASTEHLIADIRKRGGLPIVVGGTHLYIKALLDGLFEGPQADEKIRAELTQMDSSALHAKLVHVDPESSSRIHRNDRKRLIRAIEVYQITGIPISTLQQQWDANRRDDALLVPMLWPTELINTRINARIKHMMERGLLDEVRQLAQANAFGLQSCEALGYKQLLSHLASSSDLDEAVERIKVETRRFAKNQRTWIRRLSASPPVLPIQADQGDPQSWADRITERLFDQ